jgi:hypothetical protein
MFYNHHAEPNIKHIPLPPPTETHKVNAVAFVAWRDIEAGEELVSNYGDANRDNWFEKRGIKLVLPSKESSRIPTKEKLYSYHSRYCSKIYVGMSATTWKNEIQRYLPPQVPFRIQAAKKMHPTVDSGVGSAVAKVAIRSGARIDIAPALLLPRKLVRNTILAPLVLLWEDLDEANQQALKQLRDAGQLQIQYQSEEAAYDRTDAFDAFESTVLFPAGNLGLVRRVGWNSDSSNCRLRIHATADPHSVAITLELIATKDIAAGEILKVNLPPAGIQREQALLLEELKRSGQAYYEGLEEDEKTDTFLKFVRDEIKKQDEL